jgi:hypothetical protein
MRAVARDTTPRTVVRVGNAADVAPFLIQRILDRLSLYPRSWFEQRFLPLAPMLNILKETVNARGMGRQPIRPSGLRLDRGDV